MDQARHPPWEQIEIEIKDYLEKNPYATNVAFRKHANITRSWYYLRRPKDYVWPNSRISETKNKMAKEGKKKPVLTSFPLPPIDEEDRPKPKPQPKKVDKKKIAVVIGDAETVMEMLGEFL